MAPEASAGEYESEELTGEELLVEEVSIDGMCGVY
jgi:mycofactocin precursor